MRNVAWLSLLLLIGCKTPVAPTPPLAPPVIPPAAPLNAPIGSAAVPIAIYYDYDIPNAFMLCVPQAPNGGDGINFWCWYPASTAALTVSQ